MGLVTFTHGWSWFCRLLQILVQIVLVGVLILLYDLIVSSQKLDIPDAWNGVFLVVFVLCGFFFVSVTYLGPFFHVLSTWLYLNYTLKADMSWNDADEVAWVFSPNETERWYPLLEAKGVPRESRRDYILDTCKKLMSPEMKAASPSPAAPIARPRNGTSSKTRSKRRAR